MDNGLKKQVDEWFNRGEHDLHAARLLFENKGYSDSIALHIHQAAEKYLKGYLVALGKKPPKVHELDFLLHQIEPDEELVKYLDFCERASKYYYEGRYPPGPVVSYPYDIIREDLEALSEMIQVIIRKPILNI